ncbi:hypothetical protein QM480_08945 [Flectobacillus sp. DC10W]|uniref:Uncharacterized protein n=1 Tax=Flectobacillus longus TaxID=2984207 RepID=A0ABT6YLI8_9BACT|nr:hypothetical protein [Flectobacillus longus]MDI9864450.1 hypothetical protein [Flectobacillus longus]
MAQTLTVKPQYVNTAQVFLNGKSILLNNNLTQEQLLAIWQKAEFRPFIDITYTNVADSFPENFEIDPTLFHAYDSGEVTHNPAKTNYPANTVGKHLNETRGKIDAFDNAFIRPSLRPTFLLDLANSRFLDPRIKVVRDSIGTYFDRSGVMKIAQANRPRFTHNPSTFESLGILREEERVNYFTYSDCDGVIGQKPTGIVSIVGDNMAVVSNEIKGVGPNNLCCKHTRGTVNDNNCGGMIFSADANTVYTLSLYYFVPESNIGNEFTLRAEGTSLLVPVSRTIDTTFKKGFWNREEITVTTNSAGQLFLVPRFSGVGNVMYSDAYQAEKGLFASSYIPTTDAPVTRKADSITITGDLFNELFPAYKEGTLFISALPGKKNNMYGRFFEFRGASTAGGQNCIAVNYDAVFNNQVYCEVYLDGVNQCTFTTAPNTPQGVAFQLAFAWRYNDSKMYFNGVESVDDNSILIPANINVLNIGIQLNSTIKQIAFWPIRLPNAVLESLSKVGLMGKNPNQFPSISDLGRAAFINPFDIMRSRTRQEFSVDGTGASVTRNIRRDYDFTFEIVDSSGVTVTAQPASSCTAGTDNALTFTAPVGKTLTYAITPVYEN